MWEEILIRSIQPADNASLASIIRSVLEEFGANKPGTVYYDRETDFLYELFYNTPGSAYQVVVLNGILVGGAGVFPTPELPEGMCELVKMYLLPSARGKGLGKALIEGAFDQARNLGYRKMYLETMPELKTAIGMYEKMGFNYLEGPLGKSGHNGCDIWMERIL
ncbi:MAG: GNAT family N-acetyltransferase [Sediminibacterium sp.]